MDPQQIPRPINLGCANDGKMDYMLQASTLNNRPDRTKPFVPNGMPQIRQWGSSIEPYVPDGITRAERRRAQLAERKTAKLAARLARGQASS